MRKTLLFLALIASFPAFGQSFTTVTAANVLVDNGSGTAIHPPSGSSLCFLGVNSQGAAITYTPSGGSPTSGTVCQTLTSGGALTGSLQVANGATASPIGLLFTITVVNGSTTYLTIPMVSVSGTVFNYDAFGLQGTQRALGIGFAHLACSYGSTWTSTTLPSGENAQTCNTAGQWAGYPPNPYCPSGMSYLVPQSGGTPMCQAPTFEGQGAPSGFCTEKSTYLDLASGATNFWGCKNATWSLIGSSSPGVTSINGAAGSFTFSGPGVSCSTTTCTFSGGGGTIPNTTQMLAGDGAGNAAATNVADNGGSFSSTDPLTVTPSTVNKDAASIIGLNSATSSTDEVIPGEFGCPNMTTSTARGCELAVGVPSDAAEANRAQFEYDLGATPAESRGVLSMSDPAHTGYHKALTWDYLGNVYLPQLLSQGSVGTDSNGKLIAGSSSMVYPAAGIPNSTGSAWGTSYSGSSQIPFSFLNIIATNLNTLIQGLTGCSTTGNVYTPQGSDCVPQSGGAGGSTTVIYASAISGTHPGVAVSAGSSATSTADSAAALNTAIAAGNIDLEVDSGFALSTSLVVGSNTTIHCTSPQYGFIMQTAANAPVIVNAHQTAPTTASGTGGFLVSNQTDNNIKVIGCMLNTNSTQSVTGSGNTAGTPHTTNPSTGIMVMGIQFAGIAGVTFTNNEVYDTGEWGIGITNTSNAIVNSNYFHQPLPTVLNKNTSGPEIVGPVLNVEVNGNVINSGDSAIEVFTEGCIRGGEADCQITNWKWGPIQHVHVEHNIIQSSGGGDGILLLDASELIDDVDIGDTQGIVCGWGFYAATWAGLNPGTFGYGNLGRINVHDWKVNTTGACSTLPYNFMLGLNAQNLDIGGVSVVNPAVNWPIVTSLTSEGVIKTLNLHDFITTTTSSTISPSLVYIGTGSVTNLVSNNFTWNDTVGTGIAFGGSGPPTNFSCSSYTGRGAFGTTGFGGFSAASNSGDCFQAFQTAGTNNTDPKNINFVPSTVDSTGLHVTPSNPSTNTEKFEITGTFGSGVTNITPGANVTCSPLVAGVCTGAVTVNSTGGGGYPTPEVHTASNSAELDFTSCITSSNRDYDLRFSDVTPASATQQILVQVSTNGGSTYDTTSAHYITGYAYVGVNQAQAITGSPQQTFAGFYVGGYGITTAATVDGTVHLFNLLNSTATKHANGMFTSDNNTTSSSTLQWMGGIYTQTAAVNAIRVIAASGNIASGTVTCQPLP